MQAPNQTCRLIEPGAGATFFAITDWVTLKVSAQDTGGSFAMVEQTTLPQARPPRHKHQFDEVHYVLEGEYEYEEEGQPPRRVGAGTVFITPRGVVHTYKNVGTGNGRVLAIFSPPGFEQFFAAIGAPAGDTMAAPPAVGAALDAAEVAKVLQLVYERFGTEVVEPVTVPEYGRRLL